MAIFIAPVLAHPTLPAPAVGARIPDVPAAARPAERSSTAVTTQEGDELKVYWGRLIFAAVVLLVILVGGFTAAILKLDDWSALLIHSFELLLGIFIGLLGGDIAASRYG